MRTVLLSAVLGLAALGLPAQAQTLSVNIDASVRFPAVAQTAASLLNLLSQGVQVTFLTPTSQPAATVTRTGGIQVHSSVPSAANPRDAAPTLTQVQVSTPIPGTTQTVKEVYPLAQPIKPGQPIRAQSIVVRAADGQPQPLTSVMGRQAAWAKARGLQKKPGQMPPGQLKQLCKKEPRNALCSAPTKPGGTQPGGKGKS